MPAPIHRLRKAEIVWLANHRCKKHHHLYIEHYQCYLREFEAAKERVGFFDIETTSLDAGFGIMLSWALKLGGETEVYYDLITKADMEKGKAGDEDKRIVRSAVKKVQECDRLITHYGNDFRFDIPFLRTRAVSLKIPFPYHGTLKHQDSYPVLKKKFKLNSNRLENANRILLGHTDKTRLDPVIWRKAGRGDEKCLQYILKHNIADVKDLEKLWNEINPYIGPSNVSL